MELEAFDANAGGLALAKGKMIAPHLDFDRIAKWSKADNFQFRADREPHFEQPLPLLRRHRESSHATATADRERAQDFSVIGRHAAIFST
jgi:hypothetical protein